MKIDDIRDEFVQLEHMHDLTKRLLRVFELGVRAGAEAMASYDMLADPDEDFDPIEGVTRAVMDEAR